MLTGEPFSTTAETGGPLQTVPCGKGEGDPFVESIFTFPGDNLANHFYELP
jgi:hypothetical protein